MMSYSEQLKDHKWIRKRTIILKRDGYKCTVCGGKIKLSVHHQYYLDGKKPWQYPNNALITLCDSCHYTFHCEHETPVKNIKPKHKKIHHKKTEHELALERIANIIDDRTKAKERFHRLHK